MILNDFFLLRMKMMVSLRPLRFPPLERAGRGITVQTK